MEDEEPDDSVANLVIRFRDGDSTALDALMKRFDSRLRGIAYKMLFNRCDVEDVLQETWWAFSRHAEQIMAPAQVGAWLCTTARNFANRLGVSRGRMWPVDDRTLDSLRPAAESSDDDIDLTDSFDRGRRDAVRAAVDRLPAGERELIRLLTKSDNANYRAISEEIGRPIGSIGPTRMRVLSKLRRDAAIRQLADLDVAT